ncbi:MAG: hypothetical protein J6A63_00150 [Clostridia bacterium]|nr:hypothetical protein [Clostridia bacterium]
MEKKVAKKVTKKVTKEKKVERKSWKNVDGIMSVYATVWDDDRVSFSTSVAKKNEDGDYDREYYDVIFKNGEAPYVEESTNFNIDITAGFLTFRKANNGHYYSAVMVMEYTICAD